MGKLAVRLALDGIFRNLEGVGTAISDDPSTEFEKYEDESILVQFYFQGLLQVFQPVILCP